MQSEVVMEVPARIGDYTDFYTSKHHAFNCGSMFRDPSAALAPNWYAKPHTVLTPVVPASLCMKSQTGDQALVNSPEVCMMTAAWLRGKNGSPATTVAQPLCRSCCARNLGTGCLSN